MLTTFLDRIAALPVRAKSLLLLLPTVILIVVVMISALRSVLASAPGWTLLLAIVGVGAIITLWRVPQWQVKNLPGEDAEERQKKFELENEVRKTIAQILGGTLILAGLFFTAQQLYVAQDAQTVAREAQLDAQEAQITERFTRATEQLASDSLEIRVGGIYAFERIAKDSEKDFDPVSGILQTFVQENAPRNKAEEEYPRKTLYTEPGGAVVPDVPADIEAAIVSLAALSHGRDDPLSLYLPGTNLEGVPLSEVNFNRAYLFNTNLQYASILGGNLPKAEFFDSNLRGANLWGAKIDESGFHPSTTLNLSEANFQRAQLNHADFERADLERAKFQGATLYDADLTRVNLTEAKFQDANLKEADLLTVDLSGADFHGAQLERAILCRVNLRGAKNLTQAQLNATDDGAEVVLPEGLEEPSAWSKAVAQQGSHGYCGGG